jgi:hypothetical protein
MSSDDNLLNEFACLDPVYIDGVFTEGVVSLGANFATPFFRWAPSMREGRVIFERTPALYMIRPIASLDPRDPLAVLLMGQRSPAQVAMAFKH